MLREIAVSVVIIGVSTYFFLLTADIYVIAGFEKMPPSFWPRFNLVGIIFISLIILVRSIVKSHQQKAAESGKAEGAGSVTRVIACTLILALTVYLIPYLGFLLSAFLSTAVLIFSFGERKWRSILLTSFVLVASIYLVFGKLMYVPMPRGISIFERASRYLY